ncbi:MAG TPA: NosD domain-containing protein [Pyrinomonadaceae bacterium]|jgi:hypothetical protein|nr:NosD domain-containing protein [Pyrinomonadaceae bacterium]
MNHRRLGFWASLTLVIGLLAFASGQAYARTVAFHDDDDDDNHGATLTVDDDHVQCPRAQFTSIQAAVTAAHAGDRINVCPGTYREQVKINKPLSVQGISVANQNQAIVMPPTTAPNSTSLISGNPIAAIILVDTTDRVNLTNLTIDGSNNGISTCAGPTLVGIYYRNASGKIDSVAVRNVRLGTGFEGCQTGLAIFVQSGNGGRAKVDISNSSVHDYQKNGITANEPGTEVNIRGNAVMGFGVSPIIAQNGVQVAFGARATIDGNSIINHVYGGCTSANSNCDFAANILIIDSDGVKITRNTTGKAQVNIYYQGNRGEVSNNTILESVLFDGIDLIGNKNHATGNNIFNSGEAGIFVQGNQNDASANMINEAPVGILESAPSSGNHFNGNRFYNTGLNVVPASSTTISDAITANSVLGSAQTAPARNARPAQP